MRTERTESSKPSNEFVAYANQFNRQPLKGFTPAERDLLLALIYRVENQHTKENTFTFRDLKTLAGMDGKRRLSNKQFGDYLWSVSWKLGSQYATFIQGSKKIMLMLFNRYEVDYKEATLTIGVNPVFEFLFNDLAKEFTMVEMRVFTSLKSGYAKDCYRLLMQWRGKGVWKVTVAEFRRLLDVPDSYTVGQLKRDILAPIERELKPIINLEIIGHTKQGAKGRPRLEWLEFKFNKSAPRDNPPESKGSNTEPIATVESEPVESTVEPELVESTDENVWKTGYEEPEPIEATIEPEPTETKRGQFTLFDSPQSTALNPPNTTLVPTSTGTVTYHHTNYPDEFENLWRIWERKDSKKEAYKAWSKRNLGISHADMLKAAQAWLAMKHQANQHLTPKYLPYLSTWINQARWEELSEQANYQRHVDYDDLSNAGKWVASLDPETQKRAIDFMREDHERAEAKRKKKEEYDAEMRLPEKERLAKARKIAEELGLKEKEKVVEGRQETPALPRGESQMQQTMDFGSWVKSV